MRRLYALDALLAVSLATGCGTYASSKTVAGAGGGLILAAPLVVLAAASHPGGDPGQAANVVYIGGGLLAVGVVLAVCGLFGMAVYDDEPAHASPTSPPHPSSPEPDQATKRHNAELLLHAAQTDARANRCDSVVERSRAVAILDPQFHATVFVLDPAVHQCLTATPP